MLLFLLCLFLGCHCFYSPFHFHGKICNECFVATYCCIELIKNEVKKKMHVISRVVQNQSHTTIHSQEEN